MLAVNGSGQRVRTRALPKGRTCKTHNEQQCNNTKAQTTAKEQISNKQSC